MSTQHSNQPWRPATYSQSSLSNGRGANGAYHSASWLQASNTSGPLSDPTNNLPVSRNSTFHNSASRATYESGPSAVGGDIASHKSRLSQMLRPRGSEGEMSSHSEKLNLTKKGWNYSGHGVWPEDLPYAEHLHQQHSHIIPGNYPSQTNSYCSYQTDREGRPVPQQNPLYQGVPAPAPAWPGSNHTQLGPHGTGYPTSEDANVSGRLIRDTLDPRFKVAANHREFFVKGMVFKVFWPTTRGSNAPQSEPDGSLFDCGPNVYAKIQRFIVVEPHPNQGYSDCLPISTNEGKGAAKKGLLQEQHTMAYTSQAPPPRLPAETRLNKEPIKVDLVDPSEKLDFSSRINLAKPYPVEHNIRVCEIGKITGSNLRALLHYHQNEMRRFQSSRHSGYSGRSGFPR